MGIGDSGECSRCPGVLEVGQRANRSQARLELLAAIPKDLDEWPDRGPSDSGQEIAGNRALFDVMSDQLRDQVIDSNRSRARDQLSVHVPLCRVGHSTH